MALFGQGGKSRLATSSSANTRPSACARATCSVSIIGAASASASRRANASSTGINDVLTGTSTTAGAGLGLLEVGDEVARTMTGIKLLGKDAIPTGTHRVGRTWQTADQGAVSQPGQGA
ncbi:hypothetical protein D3C79_724420 [compost metagenome]